MTKSWAHFGNKLRNGLYPLATVVLSAYPLSSRLFAQSDDGSSNQSSEELSEITTDVKTVLQRDLWISPRAEALGGALSTLADGPDAPYFNPAGIGGLFVEKKSNLPLIRQFHFPWLAVTANKQASSLRRDFIRNGAHRDATIAGSLVDAEAGHRQYGRASSLITINASRLAVVPFSDIQLAAVPQGGSSELIDLHYRRLGGVGAGISICDPSGKLYLGYFGYRTIAQEMVKTVTLTEAIDPDARKIAATSGVAQYDGTGANIGAIWRLGNIGRPTLALVSRNAGGTVLRSKDPEKDDIVFDEDLTAGFSVSPRIGKSGAFTLITELSDLTDRTRSLREKSRVGLELSLGGLGSFATFALRAGGNSGGISGGLAIYLGLINLEASTYARDIGAGNSRVIDRRNSLVFSVNVAEL